jgi:hypothetical protein
MLKKAGLSLAEIKGKLEKGQKSEAGGQRSGDGQTNGIDLLAERVAEAVKMEVFRFFRAILVDQETQVPQAEVRTRIGKVLSSEFDARSTHTRETVDKALN